MADFPEVKDRGGSREPRCVEKYVHRRFPAMQPNGKENQNAHKKDRKMLDIIYPAQLAW